VASHRIVVKEAIMAAGALSIGLSALEGYQLAMDTTANNIANAATDGFVPSRAVFTATASSGNGVFVTVSPEGRALAANAPSQTDLPSEMINLLTYKMGYLAAAKTVKVQDQLLGSLLNTHG
jgi:flagellar hook-associated protein FlgK